MKTHDALFKVFLFALFIVFLSVFTSCTKHKPETNVYETQQPGVETQQQPGTEEGQAISEEELAAQQRQAAEAMQRGKEAAQQKFVNEDVFFDFDDASLTQQARSVLKQKVQWLREIPGVSVMIEGHCDERGTVEYNIALGERRAQSIKTYLANAGIDPSRLQTISYGEERPIDPGHNEEAWAKNRRGHFRIIER
jgi:peptidoglycan-associated lipoprotein